MNRFFILAITVAVLNIDAVRAGDLAGSILVAAPDRKSVAVETQAVPNNQNELSLLETAIGKQIQASEKVAFNLRYDSDFTNAHFTVFYDPDEVSDKWAVIEPPGHELSAEVRASMIETVSSVEAQHVFGGIAPDFFASIDSPVEVVESEWETSYDFTLPSGQLSNRGEQLDAGDAIRVTITVDRATEVVTRMRTYSVKSFKPNRVARVTKFEQDLHFIALPDADVAVLKHRRDDIIIRAFFFKKMVEDWRYSYSDYEIVR